MTPDETMHLAFDLFQSGRHSEAETLCRSILAADPAEHRALRILGAVCYRRREFDQAEQFLRQAARLNPNSIEYLDNLCAVLNGAGKSAEAEAIARHVLQLAPTYVPASLALGTALKEQNRLQEAETAFRDALRGDPTSMNGLNNLANVLRMRGQANQGAAIARQALTLYPQTAELWLNLGAALHDQQRHEEAIPAFQRALQLRPDLALAAFNCGVAQEALDRLSEAEASYRQALAIQPGLLIALNNLGVVLKSQGRLEEALECFEQALAQRPDYMIAQTNILLTLQCLPDVAPETLLEAHRDWDHRHALPFHSDWSFPRRPRPDLQTPDWSSSAATTTDSTATSAEEHEAAAVPGSAASARPLRVGLVSPDLGKHPVGRFLIAAFEKLDPAQIETVCYSHRRHPDEITARFQQAAQLWRDTRWMSDEQLAGRIREDRIDVLIDLTGHTGQHRLQVFARRPAPVQATWIGYAGTTGLTAMDWLIADPHLLPVEHEPYYSERIIRLPHGHFCVEPPAFAPDCVEPPCRRTGRITFGSFNKPDKTTKPVIDTWAAILLAVPDARLILRNRGLDDPAVAGRFRHAFQQQGVSPERIEIYGWTSHADLLKQWNEVDIALDTFPFSGGATSIDALWMGVPIVTLPGATFASRQTFSLLRNIGEDRTIASSLEDFIERAVQLAESPALLSELRATLRERFRSSPLCDADSFAQNLTRVLKQLGSW